MKLSIDAVKREINRAALGFKETKSEIEILELLYVVLFQRLISQKEEKELWDLFRHRDDALCAFLELASSADAALAFFNELDRDEVKKLWDDWERLPPSKSLPFHEARDYLINVDELTDFHEKAYFAAETLAVYLLFLQLLAEVDASDTLLQVGLLRLPFTLELLRIEDEMGDIALFTMSLIGGYPRQLARFAAEILLNLSSFSAMPFYRLVPKGRLSLVALGGRFWVDIAPLAVFNEPDSTFKETAIAHGLTKEMMEAALGIYKRERALIAYLDGENQQPLKKVMKEFLEEEIAQFSAEFQAADKEDNTTEIEIGYFSFKKGDKASEGDRIRAHILRETGGLKKLVSREDRLLRSMPRPVDMISWLKLAILDSNAALIRSLLSAIRGSLLYVSKDDKRELEACVKAVTYHIPDKQLQNSHWRILYDWLND